jgi:hypothetical protein
LGKGLSENAQGKQCGDGGDHCVGSVKVFLCCDSNLYG